MIDNRHYTRVIIMTDKREILTYNSELKAHSKDFEVRSYQV